MNVVIKLFQLKEPYSYTIIMGTIYPHWSACLSFSLSLFLSSLWSWSILRWCVLLKSETGAILMLLYLTSALFFRCLKIAVNYKCSLNVSSDPEMQVGMRQIVCLIWNRCIFTEHSEFSLPSVSSSWVISIRYWAGLVLCYAIPHIWTGWKKSGSLFCACVCVPQRKASLVNQSLLCEWICEAGVRSGDKGHFPGQEDHMTFYSSPPTVSWVMGFAFKEHCWSDKQDLNWGPSSAWFDSMIQVYVTKSCLTICNPIDCSSPGFSVHGILQARILEWLSIAFSRRSSWPRDRTQVSCIAGRIFTLWATREAPVQKCLRTN